MPRQPSIPGTVRQASMPVSDEALDSLIDTADSAMREDCSRAEAAFLLIAMPNLLRELRQHRRTAALPAIGAFPTPANSTHAPLRVS